MSLSKLNVIIRKKELILFYCLPVSILLLTAWIIYPYYQYGIISDDISYLTLTKRYLSGDTAQAINGFWSPLNIWILAGAVKLFGTALIPTAYWINVCSFTGILILSTRLFHQFFNNSFHRLAFGIASAFFWAGNIPLTFFADALNCCLLLACLLLLLKKNFHKAVMLWISLGIIAALAYLSKAYSFYIIPVITAIGIWVILKSKQQYSIKKHLGILSCILLSMILFSVPWIIALHHKYGFWTISTAGTVNLNWAIRGTIFFDKSLGPVIPPAYPDSLSCWEDLFIHHGELLHPWNSWHLLLKEITRIGINGMKWVKTVNEFSPFYLPVCIGAALSLFSSEPLYKKPGKAILIVALLLFPLGYLPLVLATRYLWFTVPLNIIIGLLFAKQTLYPFLKPKFQKIFVFLFFLSWFPGLILELKESFREGTADYHTAQILKKLNIQGSFIGNTYLNYQQQFRLSYYSNNPFYMHFGDKWSTAELLMSAKKYNIDYYFYFYNNSGEDYQLDDKQGNPYPELTGDRIKGLKIFHLNQAKGTDR